MEETTLMNDIYSEGYLGNGIFTDLQNYDVPWKSDNIETQLDIVYYSKSGEKTVSNMILNRITNGELPTLDRLAIANAIFIMFNEQWSKLYNTLSFQYDPIENYRMIETEELTIHNENTGTETGSVSRDATNQRTDTGTVNRAGTDSNTSGVYGFNSSSSVNSDTSSGNNSMLETRNLSNSESIDDTETRNLNNTSETDSEHARELIRSGNIGVTTSQQMIDSERRLWEWNFFNVVFSNIDSILCLDVYYYSESEG